MNECMIRKREGGRQEYSVREYESAWFHVNYDVKKKCCYYCCNFNTLTAAAIFRKLAKKRQVDFFI